MELAYNSNLTGWLTWLKAHQDKYENYNPDFDNLPGLEGGDDEGDDDDGDDDDE